MILAFETSGKTASVAVVKNGCVVCESSQTLGFFHSQTLMVLLSVMLKTAKIQLTDLNLVAVSNGPGSFTGLRIGVAAARGLATGLGINCVGISTLRGLAANLVGMPVVVCVLIDARNDFFYCGLFDAEFTRRLDCDEVVSFDSLALKLQALNLKFNKPIVFVGDGAKTCFLKFKNKGLNLKLSLGGEKLNLVSAASIGLCACVDQKHLKLNTNFQINYMRQSQAQRLLDEKLQNDRREK